MGVLSKKGCAKKEKYTFFSGFCFFSTVNTVSGMAVGKTTKNGLQMRIGFTTFIQVQPSSPLIF